MVAISPKTREIIKAYLEVFIENLVNNHQARPLPEFSQLSTYVSQVSPQGRLKPFHVAIMPNELMRITAFERSFSTNLGTTFEECARLIALEHHADAKRGYEVKGYASSTAVSEIERQVAIYERSATNGTVRPSFEEMVTHVLNAQTQDERLERTARADLYILSHEGHELFFEIKSPVPNKGQCLEVTQRLLRFHLLRNGERPSVQSYFAMAYNPYGSTRSEYRWTYAKNYMPFDQAVVIGQEFWTIVGGPSAYHELLEIYQEVGQAKIKYILDTLAFGF